MLLEVRRQIPKNTTDDHYYQSVAAMTRCKRVASGRFLLQVTGQRSHVIVLLTQKVSESVWDTFCIGKTMTCDLQKKPADLAVLSFSSYQVFETFILPKIIANYSFLFLKCFVILARQKKFPDLRKIIIFCQNNEQKDCPPF